MYWVLELPFIIYGLLLGLSLSMRENLRRTVGLTVPGIAFHLLGPAFNFPLLGEYGFVGLGVIAMLAAALALVWESRWQQIKSPDGQN